jgi:hypothetical protein
MDERQVREARVREAREWVADVRDHMPGFGSPLNESWEEQLIALVDALAAREAEVARLRGALLAVREWEANLVPADGIRYGSYFPAFAVSEALAAPPPGDGYVE